MDAKAVDLARVQGLVRSGYGKLEAARFALFRIADVAAARRWLGELNVTPASRPPERTAINVAFTYSGLRALGLEPGALAMLPEELVGGMTTPHRRRLLGDHGDSAPEQWDWGGPTREVVDGVLMLYADGDERVDALVDRLLGGGSGLAAISVLDSSWLPRRKEQFGFRDGIAQPAVQGVHADGLARNRIAAGEIVLGYRNQYGKLPLSPLLAEPSDLLGGRDFGAGGSFVVMRQLEQDVAGFWAFIREAAGAAGLERRVDRVDAAIYLAAKMVGRWPSGAPMTLARLADDPSREREDDFGYAEHDADGHGCPFGSHIRRTNPRDWFLGADAAESQTIANRHRILRRGRAYGPPLVSDMDIDRLSRANADGTPRGLHFVCLNANIGRQFEFVQNQWVNNPVFGGLYGGADPLLGDHEPETSARDHDASFVIQGKPVRTRITGMRRFVRVRGGAYFMLPSLPALKYLAAL